MNLTHLSLYHGRDVDTPPPTNHERRQALRDVIAEHLENNVFQFPVKKDAADVAGVAK
jgi:hypothetical protein